MPGPDDADFLRAFGGLSDAPASAMTIPVSSTKMGSPSSPLVPAQAQSPILLGGAAYQQQGYSVPAVRATAFIPDEPSAGHDSAYGGTLASKLNGKIGVSLPHRFDNPDDYIVEVTANGKTVQAPIADVGPWNEKDPYWMQQNGRPAAESGVTVPHPLGGFSLSGARGVGSQPGIDLSTDTARALFPEQTKGKDDDWVAANFGGHVNIRVLKKTDQAIDPWAAGAASLMRDIQSPQSQPSALGAAASSRISPKMSDDELIQAVGGNPALVKSSGWYRPDFFRSGITDPMGVVGTTLRTPLIGQALGLAGGLYRAARDPIDAIAQLGVRGAEKLGSTIGSTGFPGASFVAGVLPNKADAAFQDVVTKLAEKDYEQNWETPVAGLDVARFAGLMMLPLPKGFSVAEDAPLWARSAANAIKGAAIAPVMAPDLSTSAQPSGPAENFWWDKGSQATAGLAGGAAMTLGADLARPVLGKAVNAIQGIMPPAYGALQRLAKKWGVDLTVGDVTQNPTIQRAETLGEKVPFFGMTPVRAEQQAQVRRAATDFADRLRNEMIAADFENIEDIKTAANDTTSRRHDAAVVLLNEMANAGENWSDILRTSGNVALFNRQLQSDRLYARVDQLAHGTGDVTFQKTRDAILNSGEELRGKYGKDGLKTELGGYLDWLEDPSADHSYAGAKAFRESLGSELAQMAKGEHAMVSQVDAPYIRRILEGLNGDMEDHALASGKPELADAYKEARAYYRTEVGPYVDAAIGKAFRGADADEIYGAWVKMGKGDRAKRFYNALDPKGQKALRYGIAQSAIDKASQPQTGFFSPQGALTYLNNMDDPSKAVFQDADSQRELEGFKTILQHTIRAGQYLENPPTGQQNIQRAMAGDVAGAISGVTAPGKIVAAGSMAGLARVLFTTDWGKRILLASSDLKAGSPALDTIVNQVSKRAAQIGAAAGGKAEGGKLDMNAAPWSQENDPLESYAWGSPKRAAVGVQVAPAPWWKQSPMDLENPMSAGGGR